jgi:hypothetical protein
MICQGVCGNFLKKFRKNEQALVHGYHEPVLV